MFRAELARFSNHSLPDPQSSSSSSTGALVSSAAHTAHERTASLFAGANTSRVNVMSEAVLASAAPTRNSSTTCNTTRSVTARQATRQATRAPTSATASCESAIRSSAQTAGQKARVVKRNDTLSLPLCCSAANFDCSDDYPDLPSMIRTVALTQRISPHALYVSLDSSDSD